MSSSFLGGILTAIEYFVIRNAILIVNHLTSNQWMFTIRFVHVL